MELQSLVGQELVEVLYSPMKAFRKIIEKPDFKAVIIVLLLVIGSTVALQFVYNSKQLYEIRDPSNDEWTEALTNQHVWTSVGSLTLDVTDYKMGNSSIKSSAFDATDIGLKVTGFDPVSYSDEKGYNKLFFWINWTNSQGASPSSVTIKLFSISEDSYFEKDLVDLLPSNGEWGNIGLDLGSDQGWVSINSADWASNITGIEFGLVWSDSADLTLEIDGLYFNNFVSPIVSVGFEQSLLYIFVSVALNVGINWVLWSGILLLVAKVFGEDVGQWNVFFIIFGYAFIATAVYTLVSALIFTSLPILSLPLDNELQIAAFSKTWLSNIVYQVGTGILWAGEVWVAALGAIVIKLLKNIPWGKAGTIAGVAFVIRFLLRFFFGF